MRALYINCGHWFIFGTPPPSSPTDPSHVSLPMNLLGALFSSSIGKKFLVALTGLVLIGFVTGHLIGNLQIFLAPEKINGYAHLLESLGELLWFVRIFLLVCVVVHIWLAIQLTAANRAARPLAYGVNHTIRASVASRVMAVSGLVVLAFVIFHLAHFTLRISHPEWGRPMFQMANGAVVRDVHTMMVQGFSNLWVSLFYVLSVGLLSYHLSHGLVSSIQTLGFKNEKWTAQLQRFATAYCWLYFLGNAAIPLAVLGGFVKLHA